MTENEILNELADDLERVVKDRLSHGRTLEDAELTGGKLRDEFYRTVARTLESEGPYGLGVHRQLNELHEVTTNRSGIGIPNLNYSLTFTGGTNKFKLEIMQENITVTSSSDSLYDTVMSGRENFRDLQIGKEEYERRN